jgi:hypothetical protein
VPRINSPNQDEPSPDVNDLVSVHLFRYSLLLATCHHVRQAWRRTNSGIHVRYEAFVATDFRMFMIITLMMGTETVLETENFNHLTRPMARDFIKVINISKTSSALITVWAPDKIFRGWKDIYCGWLTKALLQPFHCILGASLMPLCLHFIGSHAWNIDVPCK